MPAQTIAHLPAQKPAQPTFRRVWRNWWLRAAKAQQRKGLQNVLTDPHLARDLGLPVVERERIRFDLW